ncbi:MAG TPA: sugar ABC transporter permease [Firmicutes bacterium]|nr:sugar ABC transporter permease [Bacillota bacterium]
MKKSRIAGSPSGPRLFNKRDNQMIGLVFVLPFLIGFVFIFARMLYDGLHAAFSTAQLGTSGMTYTFTGWDNFYYALRVDPLFISRALEDLKSLLVTIPLIMIFSLFVAVVLNNEIWGRTVFRVIFFLPVIVSTGLLTELDANNAVMTTMSAAAVESSGDSALASIGDISLFLQQLQFSPGLIEAVSGVANNVVEIVNRSGVQILIFLAGIQSISPSIYEAADVEGATAWEKFWKITLPMVSPIMVVCLVYTVVECLTGSSSPLMSHIEYLAFTGGKFGEAAAMAWLYFAAVVLVIGVAVLVIRGIGRAGRNAGEGR